MPRQTGAFEMVLTLWPLSQTFSLYTCTYGKGFASDMCLSKLGILLRPWRKLLTNPGRRENTTQVRNNAFYPEIRTFHTHFLFLILFPYVQLIGTKWGNDIRENKIKKHSKLVKNQNSRKTIYYPLQTCWKYKICKEICHPTCACTSSHPLIWQVF